MPSFDPASGAPAISATRAAAHRAASTILRTAAAEELTESIRGPAAVVNDQREVVFANRHFLGLARVAHLDEVLGRRLGELLGLIPRGSPMKGRPPTTVHPVTEALEGRASTATSTVSLAAVDSGAMTHLAISAVPMRLHDRTFALVQFAPAGAPG